MLEIIKATADLKVSSETPHTACQSCPQFEMLELHRLSARIPPRIPPSPQAAQLAEDSAEDLATIPRVGLADLEREVPNEP